MLSTPGLARPMWVGIAKGTPFHGQHDQWFLFRSGLLYSSTGALFLPIFTCGFVLSKTVASPRAALRSLPKTCCMGLIPFFWRTASRLVLIKGAIEREKVDILRPERKNGRMKTESGRMKRSIRGQLLCRQSLFFHHQNYRGKE